MPGLPRCPHPRTNTSGGPSPLPAPHGAIARLGAAGPPCVTCRARLLLWVTLLPDHRRPRDRSVQSTRCTRTARSFCPLADMSARATPPPTPRCPGFGPWRGWAAMPGLPRCPHPRTDASARPSPLPAPHGAIARLGAAGPPCLTCRARLLPWVTLLPDHRPPSHRAVQSARCTRTARSFLALPDTSARATPLPAPRCPSCGPRRGAGHCLLTTILAGIARATAARGARLGRGAGRADQATRVSMS
jgi:hypothetical protein